MVRADGQEVLPAIASHVRWLSKTRESSPILPLTEPEGRGKGPLLLCWPSSFFWRGSCVRLFWHSTTSPGSPPRDTLQETKQEPKVDVANGFVMQPSDYMAGQADL